MTIPKIIHYCWFGRNPLPPLAEKCIASWRKYLPDYEIKEWNEDNFDISIVPYVEEAYHMKKYAFVSDYARFYILYHHGGIYFDVDVEVLKPFDDILAKGPFMGLEGLHNNFVYRGCTALPNAGLGMAAFPKMDAFSDMLKYYSKAHFISWKGKLNHKTVVLIMTDILLDRGDKIDAEGISLCSGLYLYPVEYFNPMNDLTGEITITDNTRSIHHYAGTWVERKEIKGLAKHVKRTKNLMVKIKLGLKRVFRSKQ